MLKSIAKKLTAAAMFFLFVSLPATAFASGLVKAADITGGNGDGHSGGSNIYFGQYWQSYKGSGAADDKANYNYEGIKWRVLANNAERDADGNMGLLLLSDEALYADAFQSDGSTNDWKDAEIRTTLNNATAGSGFAGDAFATKEYAAINSTTHKQGGYDTGKSELSTEKVFMLSVDDSMRVDYGFVNGADPSCKKRKASATTFAQSVKMYGNTAVANVSYGYTRWWLRSSSLSSGTKLVISVEDAGYIHDAASRDYHTARPALNLNSSAILFLSAATGGKSAVAVGSGFALADYTGHDYKITLKDSSLSKPAVTLKINGGELNGTFSGASTGTNKYLSVWLLDADRKGINYAKLANCSASGSGNFLSLSFANVPDGKYILQFFSEEANGDYLGDYASEVYEQSVAVYGGKVTQLNPQLPTIDKTKAEFDKNAPADIAFTLTNVAQIVKVTLGGKEMTQYSYADGVFTLQKEALVSRATGDYLLSIKTDNGTLEAIITVKDSSSPEPEPSSGGGGGCNAGFGVLALIMALPMFYRKKK